MEEAKIKSILENKLTLLAKLTGQMDKQVKSIDQDDETSLTKILDEKESVIASLVREDQELKKGIALLDNKSRVAIANKLKDLGTKIESEIEKIANAEEKIETIQKHFSR